LVSWRDGLTAYRRVGCDWLLARVTARRRTVAAELRRAAGDDFARAEKRLRRRLIRYRKAVPGYERETPQAFSAVVSGLLRQQAGVLGDSLRAVPMSGDDSKAHTARIEAKRLRYLLEPVASMVEGGPAVINRLKQLQQVLGDWHDLDLLAAEVVTGLKVAAAQRARRLSDTVVSPGADELAARRAARAHERPGLLALERLVRDRKAAVISTFAAEWLAPGYDPLLSQILAVGERLAARSPGAEYPNITLAG